MDDFEIELQMSFLGEARDLLQATEKSFLDLEKAPSNKQLVDAIFRFAHNLKGTSRAVGLGQIAELTHVAENLLLAIKDDRIQVTAAVVTGLLEFNDKVREMIEGLTNNLEAKFSCESVILQLEELLKGNKEEAPAVSSSSTPVMDPVETSAPAPTILEVAQAEPSGEKPTKTAPEEASSEEIVSERTPHPKQPPKKVAAKEDETIRVSLNRMEKLNDLVGELVILQSLVEGHLLKIGEHKTSRSLGKLCKDIQDLSMSLRMVPVGPTFQKLSRVVRDTSKHLGKKVDLRIIGEDTEIDKTVVESLGDPLVHIIRNAIDHGVEAPHDRLLDGKPEEGVVEVMAFHEGNYLIIQITDDGKGIDGKRLIEKAKSKGIIPPNAELTEQQGIELIFHPGFSTKDQVSEVSGRGVGMDVVKTNIEALGGEVKVRSKVGAGSCFRLMLPLTLAIIEGMLIETGGNTYIIPKAQVQEVNKIESAHITRMTGQVPYLSLRSEVLPLYYLEHDLGSGKTEDSEIAIIVYHGELSFAVGITDILRQQQVVVKPPTKELYGKPGIMGTTILGDGKPALILDLLNLYSSRVKKELRMNNKQSA